MILVRSYLRYQNGKELINNKKKKMQRGNLVLKIIDSDLFTTEENRKK